MPSHLRFAAAKSDAALALTVKEDPEEVAEAFANASGAPVRLTQAGGADANVYVNPATVAYWTDLPSPSSMRTGSL